MLANIDRVLREALTSDTDFGNVGREMVNMPLNAHAMSVGTLPEENHRIKLKFEEPTPRTLT